ATPRSEKQPVAATASAVGTANRRDDAWVSDMAIAPRITRATRRARDLRRIAQRACRALLRPHLDAGTAAAGQVAIAELDPADPALVTREIDHLGSGVLAEERVDLGVERLAVAEVDHHVDHLEIAVEHHDGQLAEPALRARHVDPIVVLAVGVDVPLAEHR